MDTGNIKEWNERERKKDLHIMKLSEVVLSKHDLQL